LIIFLIYLLVITALIYYNGFFRLFNDADIGKRTFAGFFLLKALAVPVFYFLFLKVYGGIDDLDAGKFYHDARIMNSLAYIHPSGYLKMLLGLQDDSEGSSFYPFIVLTNNWDNGQLKDFFYNDNRIIIRIHSLLHFIAFNQYSVHSLFACFFSFIGLKLIYSSFKELFKGKELFLLTIICFFPTLWLYTGSVLKEGWTVFFLGCILHYTKQAVTKGVSIKTMFILLFLLLISLLLKAYILFYGFVYFTAFFSFCFRFSGRYKGLIFLTCVLSVAVLFNFTAKLVKGESFVQAAVDREREFSDLAKGGIFLLDGSKYIRLPYDKKLIKPVEGRKNYFTVKKGATFIYWEHSHQKDTLTCVSNTDTLSQFFLHKELPTAGSNVNVIGRSDNIFVITGRALYFTIAYPFFFNAKGIMQLFASAENLILVLTLGVFLVGIFRSAKDSFPPIAFLVFGLSLFLIVGITTPNSGAILRYRSPAAIFILLSALYYLNGFKKRYKI
jgi:hypothetical protein